MNRFANHAKPSIFFIPGLCLFLCLISGCEREPPRTFSLYGGGILVTDPHWEREVGIAVLETHGAMGNFTFGEDGSRSDPTYKAESTSWKKENGDPDCSTSRLEFTTADGRVNRLETICLPAKDILLVSCKSGDGKANLDLCNQLIKDLHARGFKCVN
jgi:hypothetical protein